MLITIALAAMLASAGQVQQGAAPKSTDLKSRSTHPVTACGPLRRRDTVYMLERDVESAGTCFSIEADNITLDLNHHTITYATKEGSRPTFGVLAADCWDKSIAGNPCDGSHRHAAITNGKIVQGPAAAPMSHALRFGQANNMTGIVVHDLEITISAPDSIGIYSDYLPGGSDVYHNTIHNNVKVISNRHQFRGTSIKLDEEAGAKLPDRIHDNIIIGGPHTGIRSDNPAGTRIYANDISQDANYTNGFCIDAAGQGMEVFDNKCHPIHGRGIHTNASGVKIFGNTVETIDSDQNKEYEGCEINGTYGIQAESDGGKPHDILIYQNKVKVHAAACPAEAMRLTDLKGADIEIHDNSFIAVQDKMGSGLSEKHARGFSVGNVTGEEVQFTHNLVQADTAIFHMDWDGGRNLHLVDNIFVAGAQGEKTLLAEFGNGASPSHGNIFESNTVRGFPPLAARFGEFAGDSWFLVASSVMLHVSDANGKAIAGAAVRVAEVPAIAAATTNAQGDVRVVLPVARIENKQPETKYGRLTINITREGCEADSFTVSEPRPEKLRRTLACR